MYRIFYSLSQATHSGGKYKTLESAMRRYVQLQKRFEGRSYILWIQNCGQILERSGDL